MGKELPLPSIRPLLRFGVAQFLRSLVRTALREKPLIALARLDRIAHCLNAAELDGFLGDGTNVRLAFGLVGVEQRIAGASGKHEVQLPCKVVGIAYPRAHALGKKGWHLMRGVARQEHAPMSPPPTMRERKT